MDLHRGRLLGATKFQHEQNRTSQSRSTKLCFSFQSYAGGEKRFIVGSLFRAVRAMALTFAFDVEFFRVSVGRRRICRCGWLQALTASHEAFLTCSGARAHFLARSTRSRGLVTVDRGGVSFRQLGWVRYEGGVDEGGLPFPMPRPVSVSLACPDASPPRSLRRPSLSP